MWYVAAALYFTVPMVWFLIEHHALNISLKTQKHYIQKDSWRLETTFYQVHVSDSTHLQWLATHSLLQYSLSQSSLSTARLLQPDLTHTLLRDAASLDPFTSISSWRRKQQFRGVPLIRVAGNNCEHILSCDSRWFYDTAVILFKVLFIYYVCFVRDHVQKTLIPNHERRCTAPDTVADFYL